MLDARRAIVEDLTLKTTLEQLRVIPSAIRDLRFKLNKIQSEFRDKLNRLESDRLAELRKLTAIKEALSDQESAVKFEVATAIDEVTNKPCYTNEGQRESATKKRLGESAEYQALIGQRNSSQHNIDDLDGRIANAKAQIDFDSEAAEIKGEIERLLLTYGSITSVFDLAAGLSREVDARLTASDYLGRVGADLSRLTDNIISATNELKGNV